MKVTLLRSTTIRDGGSVPYPTRAEKKVEGEFNEERTRWSLFTSASSLSSPSAPGFAFSSVKKVPPPPALFPSASAVHALRGEFPCLALDLVLLILAAVVAWGRFGRYAF
ncbi:hypothetical protein ACFWDQ_13605 [Streptomyces sp. NPDC060053]|uniref:hypothetical protein n=1 Tax=Streptomyces sp. NPDC060053 TaxID=3347047 RepID=UPI003682A663